MYGKLFAQMYDGTLATKGPWQALVAFQQLVILADRHGVIDMTIEAIARRTTIPLEVLAVGVKALEEPDPDSRTPTDDGRRIVRLSDSRSWGWRIVNYGHYRNLRSAEERREYHRTYWRENRSPARSTQQDSTASTISTDAVSSKQMHKAERSSGDVDAVLFVYTEVHPRRRVTGDKPRRLVTRALKDHSAQELVEAIRGNALDPWHKEKGKHELSYVLRDSEKIDSFRALYEKKQSPRLIGVGGEFTPEDAQFIASLERRGK